MTEDQMDKFLRQWSLGTGKSVYQEMMETLNGSAMFADNYGRGVLPPEPRRVTQNTLANPMYVAQLQLNQQRAEANRLKKRAEAKKKAARKASRRHS